MNNILVSWFQNTNAMRQKYSRNNFFDTYNFATAKTQVDCTWWVVSNQNIDSWFCKLAKSFRTQFLLVGTCLHWFFMIFHSISSSNTWFRPDTANIKCHYRMTGKFDTINIKLTLLMVQFGVYQICVSSNFQHSISQYHMSSQVKTQYVQISNIVYFHLTCYFRSIHSHGKRLCGHMFDMVDTAFSYGRALIVC